MNVDDPEGHPRGAHLPESFPVRMSVAPRQPVLATISPSPAQATPPTPVLAVFLIAGPAPASLSDARIPVFTYPEEAEAAAALGRISRRAEWRPGPGATS